MGGHLLLSTHGEHQLYGLTDEEMAMFHNGQLVVKRPNSAGSNYCVSYHPESYVRDYLARGFNVIDFVPQGATGTAHQDLYLLELDSRLSRSASVALTLDLRDDAVETARARTTKVDKVIVADSQIDARRVAHPAADFLGIGDGAPDPRRRMRRSPVEGHRVTQVDPTQVIHLAPSPLANRPAIIINQPRPFLLERMTGGGPNGDLTCDTDGFRVLCSGRQAAYKFLAARC